MKNVYRVIARKPERKGLLQDIGKDEGLILKSLLKK
jgi:hypothetical protein